VTSVINRYYDPATDQFLSIDPDVAQTDQPYVFTNDDPLNAEDPLGTSDLDIGSPEGWAYIQVGGSLGDGGSETAGSGSEGVGSTEANGTTDKSNGSDNGKRSVVIGEDQKGRVEPTAAALGAGTFSPSAPGLTTQELLAENRAWINSCMDEDITIYDCGPAPGRANYPEPTSPFYDMELGQIEARQYSKVINIDIGR
jgi:hypothetical protein